MKRMLSAALAVFLCIGLSAQGTITTRKYRFSDFTDKITKVVMSGNEIMDSALRQEIVDRWTASPFEFCTADEFKKLKSSADYYFLLAAEGRFKGETEPGIVFLTLLKGGSEHPDDINTLTEVISLPLCAAGTGSGREIVFLPALVRNIQDFVLRAMESEKVAYQGQGWFDENYARKGGIKQIFLAEEDLSPKVTEKDRQKFLDEDIRLCDEDEADEAFLAGAYNTLVSYVVAPSEPVAGSRCYKMLIEADSHRLYYIHKHKITAKTGTGFLAEDLRRMAKGR